MTAKQPPKKRTRPAANAGYRKRNPDSEAKHARPRKGASGGKSSLPRTTSKQAPKPKGKPDEDRFDLEKGERIAKVMARAGLCSRRVAETWIIAGRVEVNGKKLETPAVTVSQADRVLVDGKSLPMRERTRLWLYHKPKGLVTTNRDPEGRPTVFSRLPDDLPRVLSVGRLDINTEGLLLLTNDGGLARVLELPSTGWLRRYRVRAFGQISQDQLDTLQDGVAIEGVLYGAIEATLDKEQGKNVWLTLGLREGKNREVKKILEHLGLTVNRLIRVSFGPFQLMELDAGNVREIRGKVLRDQLGEKLAVEAGADFEAPIFHQAKPDTEKAGQGRRKDAGGKPDKSGWLTEREARAAKSGQKAGAQRGRKNEAGPLRCAPHSRDEDGRPARISRDEMTRKRASQPAQKAFGHSQSPRRRIWSEDGLLEDKQQDQRTGRKPSPSQGGGDDRTRGAWNPQKGKRS